MSRKQPNPPPAGPRPSPPLPPPLMGVRDNTAALQAMQHRDELERIRAIAREASIAATEHQRVVLILRAALRKIATGTWNNGRTQLLDARQFAREALDASDAVVALRLPVALMVPREPTGLMIKAAEEMERRWEKTVLGEFGGPPVSDVWRAMYDAYLAESK